MDVENILTDEIIELLETVGVDPDSGYEDGKYIVFDLYDYDYFNEVYSKLERNIEVERDSDSSRLDEETAHVTYLYKDMLVELVGLFDEDDYSLNICEDGEEDN